MNKTTFLVALSIGATIFCYAQKQATLAFRHVFNAECAKTEIKYVLKVIENSQIPLKIRGKSFVGRKRIISGTNITELSDWTAVAMPKRYTGTTAALKGKCFYSADVEVEGELEDGKIMKVNVKETNKVFELTYQGKKWSEPVEDDAKFEEIGTLNFKHNALLERKGRDEFFSILLKLADLAKQNQKKKVKGKQYCPVTQQVLQNVLPRMKSDMAEKYADPLNQAMEEFGINTPARVNMFLAQIAHESDNFRLFIEQGKITQFKRYEKIKGLGNIHPGDGYRFRGRGPMQITGRKNYREVGIALGVDLESYPELLEEPYYAFRSAAWWWNKHGLNEKMDKYPNNVRVATRVINGGYRHIERRQQKYNYIASSMNMLIC